MLCPRADEGPFGGPFFCPERAAVARHALIDDTLTLDAPANKFSARLPNLAPAGAVLLPGAGRRTWHRIGTALAPHWRTTGDACRDQHDTALDGIYVNPTSEMVLLRAKIVP